MTKQSDLPSDSSLNFDYHNPHVVDSSTPKLPPLLCHPHFVTAYGPKNRSAVVTRDDRTIQSFKDECDINKILASYAATGQLTHVNPNPPQWGEVTATDFQTAMQTVIDARSAFDALPAKVRDRFDSDPAKLLAFLRNPENRAEAVSLGLLNAPVTPTPTPPPPPPAHK